MKLDWTQYKAVFGRASAEMDDYLSVNGQVSAVVSVSAEGVDLAVVTGDEEEEESEG